MALDQDALDGLRLPREAARVRDAARRWPWFVLAAMAAIGLELGLLSLWKR